MQTPIFATLFFVAVFPKNITNSADINKLQLK